MDVALVGLVDARGWVLLQERDEYAPTDPDRWSLVGGGIESGERPDAAARRELEEETTLVHDGLRLLGDVVLPCDLHGEDRFFVFRGETAATDDDVECREGRQIVFVDPAAADALDLTRATRALLPQVLDGRGFAAT
ncbi:NUDIX hydrolase [Nocardioides mangrovicus]|uniref:NUDIX hydrolase n=1 Tax=Nocardioides mangrovicus TaxID=2478913 RepID=A0A3L8P580_9ACTN|nr:NUDIX hydrolase [Nocardioides mangrovicus]RLV50294.1 NUDIX hydrolase [Nocardioides mangrovicus]